MRCQVCRRLPLRFSWQVTILGTGDSLTFCQDCCANFLGVLDDSADVLVTTVEATT